MEVDDILKKKKKMGNNKNQVDNDFHIFHNFFSTVQ